jgi:uncharacterized membrane protein (UPF0136 family)
MSALRAVHVVLLVYASILAVGGVVGFMKARSKVSLISGVLSALAAVVATGLSLLGYAWGIPLGMTLAIGLFLLFGYRYALSRKYMPSGMLAIVSLVVILLLMMLAEWT